MRGLLPVIVVFAAALGPAAAVAQAPLPTTASFIASDSPDRWNASGGGGANSVTIALGETVTFDVATSEPHDASFPASSGVACSAGGGPPATRIPSTPSGTWSGSCSCSRPGTIAFVCTVHDGMTGEVRVAGADGTLPGGSPPRTGRRAPRPSGAGAAPGAPQAAATAPILLAPVFVFARTQRGSIVRGTIANDGAGATATIEISARGATWAPRAAGRPARSA